MTPFILQCDHYCSDEERKAVEALAELACLDGMPLVLPAGWKVGWFRDMPKKEEAPC